MQNKHLERYGHPDRVTHLSLKDQGIDRVPEKHLGPKRARAMSQADIAAVLERRAAEGQLERANQAVGLIDLSGDIARAKRERVELVQAVDTGKADIRAMFQQYKADELAKKEAERQKALEAERAKAREVERQRQAEERRYEREARQAQERYQQERQERRRDDSPGMGR